MNFRTVLIVILVLCAATAAEARMRALDIKEPVPLAMMIPVAMIDAPVAPMQASAPQSDCTCTGEADSCTCPSHGGETCCRADSAAKATSPTRAAKRLFKRRGGAARSR